MPRMQPTFGLSSLAAAVVESIYNSPHGSPLLVLNSELVQSGSNSLISKLLSHILNHMSLSVSVVFLATIFLSKTRCLNLRMHHGLVVALMISTKVLEDHSYNAVSWSEVTRIPLKTLLHLEQQMLLVLNFNTSVSINFYSIWLSKIYRSIRKKPKFQK